MSKRHSLRNFISIFLISAIFFMYFTGCSRRPHREKFVISGTYLEVVSNDARAAGIVYKEFKRLDKIFNFYDPNSELSRLNNTYNTAFKASPELIELINLSKQLCAMTNGNFDVSCGSLYSFWKSLIQKGNIKELPPKETIEKLIKNVGMDKIIVNSAESTILIAQKGLKVDLSAIAKGYMVDKAVSRLRQCGVSGAIINAGGDIYCLGTNKGVAWKVGIKNPDVLGGIIENEILINEAIATSGDYEQFFDFNGKRYSHIINPHTGYPVTGSVASVSVVTKNCTTADGLATAFFVGGVESIVKFLSGNVSTMRIFTVTDEKGKKRIHVFR